MWTTIISTLLGIVASTIPALIGYFEEKQKLEYELAIGRLKLEAATRGYQIAVDVAGTQADVSEITSARHHDSMAGVSKWMRNLRASVRPMITYTLFGSFMLIKLVHSVVVISNEGLTIDNMETISNTIFNEPTMAILSVIIGFYFGSRGLEKFRARGGG